MRVSPAISRADSIRQTASIARWVAEVRHAASASGGLLAQPLLASRSSGVIYSPKSSASKTWRSSISAPPSNGARLSHSIASSRDAHSQIQ